MIDSAERMIETIREIGIVPFTPKKIKGWSIQEMTNPDFWFMSSDELGPWDWRIDALRSGLVFGKFISNTTAFATPLMYRHLMNWRRSQKRYRMALGEDYPVRTLDDRLQSLLSPTLLEIIRSNGAIESAKLRKIMEEQIPVQTRKQVGGHVEKYLLPTISRTGLDYLMLFLDMGTWTVTADIERVYKGPNMEYKGWQKTSVCLADDYLKSTPPVKPSGEQPFWAQFIKEDPAEDYQALIDCTPEESQQFIISHLLQFFPGEKKMLEKLI